MTDSGMAIKPLEDRVVVRPSEAEQVTASGPVIPDTAREKPQEGTVVAGAPAGRGAGGSARIPPDVEVGDTVVYARHGGTAPKHDNTDYPVLSGRDLLAVIGKR
ncbi:co-chaperone GroES [Kitasatospora sp. NPDC005856]|uniref:co-chaperone GroES n=1 Tax=Kitasatospora sp. NPDC005856 TaxID=3154566 RepID=UPI0033F35791